MTLAQHLFNVGPKCASLDCRRDLHIKSLFRRIRPFNFFFLWQRLHWRKPRLIFFISFLFSGMCFTAPMTHCLFWYWINHLNSFLQAVFTELVILALSNPDYCNDMLPGATTFQLGRLQRLQNRAVRLITGIVIGDHITPVLKVLHWVPVQLRMHFKIILYNYLYISPDTLSMSLQLELFFFFGGGGDFKLADMRRPLLKKPTFLKMSKMKVAAGQFQTYVSYQICSHSDGKLYNTKYRQVRDKLAVLIHGSGSWIWYPNNLSLYNS